MTTPEMLKQSEALQKKQEATDQVVEGLLDKLVIKNMGVEKLIGQIAACQERQARVNQRVEELRLKIEIGKLKGGVSV